MMLAISASIGGGVFADQPFSGPPLVPGAVTAADISNVPAGDGRAGTIIKPVEIPVAPVISHSVVHHIVAGGDTVASIAQQHGVPEESVRWSNLTALSRVGSQPAVGS